MYILGISCFYHESAACLIKDGIVIAASAEERFSRKKHDSNFPELAINFCLNEANISISDVDYVVFYEKPFIKFQRIFFSTIASYPYALSLFAKAMTTWFSEKLWVRSSFVKTLKIDPKKILFVPHHISHAASSFYPSGFEKSAILTVDGVGEWTTTAYGIGEKNEITMLQEIRFPHSIGLLYSVFTAFLGFEVNDGEYKVMGMAPYGKPIYLSKVRKLVNTFPDGSFMLNMQYFSFHRSSSTSYSEKFIRLFGKPRPKDFHFFTKKSGYPSYFGKKPSDYEKLCKINQHYADIAASIQAFTEELLLRICYTIHEKTKLENLCIGGGVALNSVANGILLKKGPFKRIFVQPAAGDDGGSLGAALYAYHGILKMKKRVFVQTNSYFGKSYSKKEIKQFLDENTIPYKTFPVYALATFLAEELAKGKVIGLFQGKEEWGPRALGNRSILADPRKEEMKDIVNTKVKFREPYRPFAPVTLEEKVNDYFELKGLNHLYLTKFMLGVFPVKKNKKKKIPAITHIDGSARMQVIKRSDNPLYYDIIKNFGKKTGVYVLMNTSFNLKGEPIVNTPQQAVNTFKKSGLDYLVLENFVIKKEDLA
jgi:carbamoyltransferase